jgi:uncharacterized lipoprotein YddW (UPF0748 family)
MVEEARRGGFNILFAQVRGRADAYYQSSIDPRAEALSEAPPGYDPLAHVLTVGRGAHLDVHAWVNALYAWRYPPPYPNSLQHVVIEQPDWLIVDEEGRNLAQYTPTRRAREPIEGLYLDPGNPFVRQYIVDVIRELVANYDIDGLHLDYIRYPGQNWGFNPATVQEFTRRWTVDPRLLSSHLRLPRPERILRGNLPLHLRWHAYYYALWTETRSYFISSLVREIQREVKRVRPRCVVSAAVLPDRHVAYYHKGQDWPTWLSRGYVDLIVPMAYHGGVDRIAAQMAEADRIAGHGSVFAGLGAWRKDRTQIKEEVTHLRELGISGFSYFSYQGMQDRDELYVEHVGRTLHARRASLPRIVSNKAEDVAPLLPPWEEDGASVFLRSLKKQFFSAADYTELLNEIGVNEEELLARLRREVAIFKEFTRRCYPGAVPGPEESVFLPPSVKMEAIFRYVHQKDGPATELQAYMTIQEAYERLVMGDEFGAVAREYSQGVTAALGGTQERLFLQEGWDTVNVIRTLREGQFTPVIEVPNGYIIYRVVEFLPAECRSYGGLGWALRRVAFQERFARAVAQEELQR